MKKIDIKTKYTGDDLYLHYSRTINQTHITIRPNNVDVVEVRIGKGKLLLKGENRSRDNVFTYHTFNSTEEMNEYIENMNKLIDEINNPIIEINVNKNEDYEVNKYKIEIDIFFQIQI